ncbi:hypothetical protein APUTEX25_001326 [Auxenochlorella protothecoides]|uniref:CRAL-TRIO domain-containing protein n=1 Tax=Auxenochlorella protothecoides TaxID=3075 RepID=A0A3M7L2Q8_AUXPR|nr:hypothetical protein APUTEX25_001326 [Auxenochlorella protothecoides]|eukprot:RMZ56479.1 hypothetical protein APUTEX25_001326 [Auxenochlorella protothecoides]
MSDVPVEDSLCTPSLKSPFLSQLQSALPTGTTERLGSCGEPVDGVFLQRWLSARKGSVPAAAADITAHADWRWSFLGPQGVTVADVAADLAAGKAYFQGLSRDGCPVLVLRAARFSGDAPDTQATKRLMCFLMDRVGPMHDPVLNPLGQMRVLFDLSGLNTRGLDGLYKSLLAVFEVLQQHYPERLRCLYFLSAPMLFWGVWRLLSAFVDPVTREKIRFVPGGNRGKAELLADIPEKVLPDAFGGAVPFIPVLEGLNLCRSGASPPRASPVADAQPSRRGSEHGLGAAHGFRPSRWSVAHALRLRRRSDSCSRGGGEGPEAAAPGLRRRAHATHSHAPRRLAAALADRGTLGPRSVALLLLAFLLLQALLWRALFPGHQWWGREHTGHGSSTSLLVL